MTTEQNLPRGVLLVGSVPLSDAREVMSTCARLLEDRMLSLPDGETGERLHWISHQRARFDRHPQLESAEAPSEDPNVNQVRYRIRMGQTLRFDDLGYSKFARDSYRIFRELQSGGAIRERLRFQVSLPTPLNIARFFHPEDRDSAEKSYGNRLMQEIRQILEEVPAERLAIQWDMPREIAIMEGLHHIETRGDQLAGIVDRTNRLTAIIPESTLLGVHLCYGDQNRTHFVQPRDMSVLVKLANGFASGLHRRLDWVHMPVPQERDDVDYFKPLKDLRIGKTKVFLGLIHDIDGVDGTLRRIRSANQVISDFGVSTECGLGRRPPKTIPAILDIFTQVSTSL